MFGKCTKAFSLIELMIVIAILGIVASLAIPAYNDYLTRAKVTNMISIADVVKAAVAEDRGINGNFDHIDASDPVKTFEDLGITDPVLLSQAISEIRFTKEDDYYMSIVICGDSKGQGTPDEDTVDIYFTGTYYSSGMKWGCQYTGNSKYVPSSCRTRYEPTIYGTLSKPCERVGEEPPDHAEDTFESGFVPGD